MTRRLSVVIAAYDEVENIGELTERLLTVITREKSLEAEFVFVVEGGDGTKETLEAFLGGPVPMRILYSREPAGIGAAFRRGFDAIREDRDFVVTMDADLNHSPEEIPGLLRALEESQADIVVGSRFVEGGTSYGIPLWKRLLSGTINRAMRVVFALPIRDKTSGFRVYRMGALKEIDFSNRDFAFLPEILIAAQRKGLVIVEHPIQFRFRERGRSKMGLVKTSLSYLSLFLVRRRRADSSDTTGASS
jgi:dolichol-phosphate mannosyltransferase